jgi:mRNA interferase RelE/StbE
LKPKYTVEIVPKAEKEFLKLHVELRDRIQKRILSLEENPRPFGSKKLRDTGYYRLRIRDFRVVYAVFDNEKIIKVLSIANRKDVYR